MRFYIYFEEESKSYQFVPNNTFRRYAPLWKYVHNAPLKKLGQVKFDMAINSIMKTVI